MNENVEWWHEPPRFLVCAFTSLLSWGWWLLHRQPHMWGGQFGNPLRFLLIVLRGPNGVPIYLFSCKRSALKPSYKERESWLEVFWHSALAVDQFNSVLNLWEMALSLYFRRYDYVLSIQGQQYVPIFCPECEWSWWVFLGGRTARFPKKVNDKLKSIA